MPDSRAKTISSAMRKSNSPPKILNESIAMPIADKKSGANQREQQKYSACDQHRLQGHLVFVAVARAFGEPGEHRDQRDRLHHDEEHDEKFEGLFEHDALRKKFVLVSVNFSGAT